MISAKKRLNKLKLLNSDGFTLPELAIVLIIFGLTISTVTLALKLYTSQSIDEINTEAMSKSQSAVISFNAVNGYYPCPADPTLGPGDPEYGYSAIDGGKCKSFSDTGIENDGISGRDADADGVPDKMLIGTVPFKTMLEGPDGEEGTGDDIGQSCDESLEKCLAAYHTLDAWNNKLTYAVSAKLTDPATFQDNFGIIDIVDEHKNTVLEESETAHFVIISHGENGEGAFTKEGQNISCSNTLEIPGEDDDDEGTGTSTTPDETENCERQDTVFLSGLRNETSDDYNDDLIKFLTSRVSSNWVYAADENGNIGIVNTNPGSVGVGTTEPDAQLHVKGDLSASEIQARQFCDGVKFIKEETGEETYGKSDYCIKSSMLAGNEPDMKCGENEAIVGVENNEVKCEKVFPDLGNLPAGFETNCPSGQVAIGISNINGVLCKSL